jgi:hypothetical protein
LLAYALKEAKILEGLCLEFGVGASINRLAALRPLVRFDGPEMNTSAGTSARNDLPTLRQVVDGDP